MTDIITIEEARARQEVARILDGLRPDQARRVVKALLDAEPQRNIRQHLRCACPDKPRCALHGTTEWGGGEPDVCQPHEHAARRPVARMLGETS